MSVVQYVRRHFNKNGVFVGSERFDPLLVVGDATEHINTDYVSLALVNDDAQLEILPAAGKITVVAHLNAKDDLIEQGKFADKAWRSDTVLNFWNGLSHTARQRTGGKNGESAVFLPSRGIETDSMVSLARKLHAEKHNQLAVKIEWTPAPNIWDPVYIAYQSAFPNEPNQDPERLSFNLRYSIRWAGLYFDAKNKTWNNNAVINKENATLQNFGKKESVTITTVPLPAEYTGEYDAELLIWSPSAQYEEQPDFQSARVWISVDAVEMKVLFEGKPPQEEQTLSWQNPNKKFTFVAPDYEIHHADAPEYDSRKTIYPYAWTVANVPASKWRRRGYDESKNLQNLVSEQLTRSQDKPQQKISGSMRGRMFMYSVLQHPLNRNRLFSVSTLSFYVRDGIYSGQFYEILYPIVSYEHYRITEDGKPRLLENSSFRLLQSSYNG